MHADMVPVLWLAMWGPHPGAENSTLWMLCRSGSPQDSPSQTLLQHCTSALQINKSSLNARHCCMQYVGHIIAPPGMTCGALTPLQANSAGLPDESRSIGRGVC